jgi:hypothetical protein
MNIRKSGVFALVWVLGLCSIGFGQQTGSLKGTITDEVGNP